LKADGTSEMSERGATRVFRALSPGLTGAA
jgi:hypothetical protein